MSRPKSGGLGTLRQSGASKGNLAGSLKQLHSCYASKRNADFTGQWDSSSLMCRSHGHELERQDPRGW